MTLPRPQTAAGQAGRGTWTSSIELRPPGVDAVASASPESPQVAEAADLVVDGPAGVAALLTALAGQIKN